MSANKLMKALKAPSKVASALDWKKASGSILTMDIGNGKISLALSAHPSFGEGVKTLESIPIKLETREGNRKGLSKDVTSQLQTIVKNFNVSSFVVAFPVRKEGRAGAACGKVLHTLESLMDESSTVINHNRPFCLWDKEHAVDTTDNWGRNPIYGEVPAADKTMHLASQEQYSHEPVAAQVFNDFCMKQWPDLYQKQYQKPAPIVEQSVEDVEVEWFASFEDSEAYISMAA